MDRTHLNRAAKTKANERISSMYENKPAAMNTNCHVNSQRIAGGEVTAVTFEAPLKPAVKEKGVHISPEPIVTVISEAEAPLQPATVKKSSHINWKPIKADKVITVISEASLKAAAKKKNEVIIMPEPIYVGEVITDITNALWKIGQNIGKGGFGQIYSACKGSSSAEKLSDYDCVVKFEPHNNGTLFVEMHFYMRNARLKDINKYQMIHRFMSFGMPYLIASGSHSINNKKQRFIVMPRYGADIWKLFLENGRKIPEPTIYRIALQMLDVYEYIHGRGYVHADLKGTNILLGYGKAGGAQTYLVDFGLASHYTQKDFKPDPKKMHNGTIEYTSRDAHLGVSTMRGDFEILGYNIIDWSGVMLPWEKENLLNVPVKVQKSKEVFMNDVSGSLKKLYAKEVPNPILEFLKYVATLKYNETPDYGKCRKIFLAGLNALKVPNSGVLDFGIKSTPIIINMTNHMCPD